MDLNDKYTYKKNKKEIKRIIYIRGLGKKKDKEIVQKVVFVQTLKIDKESNKIVEQSGWTLGDESNGMFPEYIPEAHEKKVTKVKKVPAKIITADDVDETVIVKYRSAKKQSTANRLKEKIDKLTSSSYTQSESDSDVNSTSVLETQSETTTQSETQSKSELTASTKSESQSESVAHSKSSSTFTSETQSKIESSSTTSSESSSELVINTKSESQSKSVAHSESSSEKLSQSNSYNESESTYDTTTSKNELELSSSAKRAMFRRGLKEKFANLKEQEDQKAKEETNTKHRQSFSFLANDYQPSQNTSFFKNNNETKASSLPTSKSQSSSLSAFSISDETKTSLLSTSESQSSSLSTSLSTSSISEETNVVSDSNVSFESESNISQSLNTSKSSALTSVENSAVSNELKEETPTPTAETEDKLNIITANEETYIKNVPSKTQQDQVVVLSNSEKFKEYQKKIFEQEKSKKDFTPRQKVPINFSILTSFLAQNNEILNNSNVYQIGQAFLLSKKWKVELWVK